MDTVDVTQDDTPPSTTRRNVRSSPFPPGPVAGVGSLSHSARYSYLRPLKEGPMSTLYEAEQVLLGRRVAVKVLPPEATRDVERVGRFLREAKLLAALRHQNIVEVFELDSREDGAICIVEEMLEGEDLESHLLRRRQLPLEEAMEIAVPVMGALVAAHREGVVHRDLKPANIFLERGPQGTRPVLLDLGIARITGTLFELPALTGPGQLLGSPLYMAPEQITAPDEVDARADVWAMGVVLYEMLAGEAPFDGPSTQRVLVRIVREEPTPLGRLRPDLPERVVRVIHAALAKDPAARHPSMQHLLGALLDCPDEPAVGAAHDDAEAATVGGPSRSSRSFLADEPETKVMWCTGAEELRVGPAVAESRPWWKPSPTLMTGMVVGALAFATTLALMAIRSGPSGHN